MKLYLDTNFIWGFFENAIKTYRKSPEKFWDLEFNASKKMKFLEKTKYELFTSNISKAEVFRKLFSEFSANNKIIKFAWRSFIKRFSVTELQIKNVDFDEIAELCLIAPSHLHK